MRYVQGAYAEHASLPAPTNTVVVNARYVDWETGVYIIDSDGNATGMDPTAQRVLITVAYDSGPVPRMLTFRESEARRKQVEASLKSLQDEGAIRLLEVTFNEGAPGEGIEQVRYVNIHTQEEQTIVRKS